MIITINQAQIELAITNYVNSKMVIADTQRLDIDLKATRGPEGYTCVIEVVDNDAPRSLPTATPAEVRPSIRETVRQARAETPAEAEAETSEPETEASAEEAPAKPVAAKNSIFASKDKPDTTPTGKNGKPSIFASHTKVSNEAPAETENEEA